MDPGPIMLAVMSLLVVLCVLAGGFLLDRRIQRLRSARWMHKWMIRNRALADLYRRWKGPLRLEDRSALPISQPRKPKVALRRKRTTKG